MILMPELAGIQAIHAMVLTFASKVDTQFGEIEIQVPRDRSGMFHQHTLPDYKQHSNVLESMIIKLYSKGVTTRDD